MIKSMIIYHFLFSKLRSLLISKVVSKSSEQYRNFITILKSFLPILIYLYLFMNFTIAILLWISAGCLPIHVLAPALNPPATNGGMLSH